MPIQFLPQAAPEFPRNALLDFSPLNSGLESVGNAMQYREKFDYQKAQNAKAEARASQSHAAGMQDRKLKQLAGVAQMVIDEPDEGKAQALASRLYQAHPEFGSLLTKYGQDPNDYRGAAKFLIAEAQGYMDPMERQRKQLEMQQTQAQIDSSRANTAYTNETRGREKQFYDQFTSHPVAAPPAQAPDPQQTQSVEPFSFAAPQSVQPQSTPQAGSAMTPRQLFENLPPDRKAAATAALQIGDKSKFLALISGQGERSTAPAGYRFKGDGNLEPIPGGPSEKLAAETAVKVGMMKAAQKVLPEIRRLMTGPPAQSRGVASEMTDYYIQRGDVGEAVRLTTGAIEGILRAASGAAVPDSEVRRYTALFGPTPLDTIPTRKRKLDSLERWISTIEQTVRSGRPVSPEDAVALAEGAATGLEDQGGPAGGGQETPGAGWSIERVE